MSTRKPKPAAPAEIIGEAFVYPTAALLARGDYLAGVGIAGAWVSLDLANEWIARGDADYTPPALPAADGEG